MPEPVSARPLSVDVIDIDDPDDLRVDDFRDLNSVDRRPDLPTLPGGRPGKGLVIAEGVLVVQRMLASRFRPRALLGTDRRLTELGADLDRVLPLLEEARAAYLAAQAIDLRAEAAPPGPATGAATTATPAPIAAR